MKWKITTNQLSKEVICSYLLRNDNIFTPPFSTRLDIKEYSDKLAKYSTHFAVYADNELIGFAACYFNHPDKEVVYISTISVIREFQRKGIGNELLRTVIIYGTMQGFEELRLKVNISNSWAIKMYEGAGFKEKGRILGVSEMALSLKNCIITTGESFSS